MEHIITTLRKIRELAQCGWGEDPGHEQARLREIERLANKSIEGIYAAWGLKPGMKKEE